MSGLTLEKMFIRSVSQMSRVSESQSPEGVENDGSEASAITEGGDDVLATAQGAVGVVHETSSAVDEELHTINELTTSQVSDMVAVSDDVSELSATIEQVASSAEEMATRSDHAADAAANGRAAATEAAASIQDVEDTIDEVASGVDRLVESVEEIDAILDVISDIAEKTNLLALNASIEASQAGHNGNSFGVVADEIKSLADESQTRTEEVEAVVEEITEATATLSDRLDSAVETAAEGSARASDAEAELDTVSDAVADVAAGLDEVATATSQGAEASERVASRCEETAESADRIDAALDDIEGRRSRQTEMVAEIDRALAEATSSRRDRLGDGPSVPSGVDPIDRRFGGFPQGCRAVLRATPEAATADVNRTLATVVEAAVEDGYAVSLSPTQSLTWDALARHLGDDRLTRLLREDRLFVIDLYEAWPTGRNVFDVTTRSLGEVNEVIAERRDDPLLVIGNIAGELHAFGEQATRENTYDNDGGVLEPGDTIVNVVAEGVVPPTLARFYAGAADVVAAVDPGPDVELVSGP